MCSLCACAPGAQAALRLGLGKAVAERSAELVNKSGTFTGDAVAATLASCSAGGFFDSYPTDLGMIGGIDPLGHVQPTGHTLPTDHIYFYSSTTTAYTPPVYAPGDIHVTEIASTRYLNATPIFTDYSISFYGCREVKGYYSHVRALAPVLAEHASAVQNCFTYSTGGSSFERCSAMVNIPLNSGATMGYVATSGSLDFGMFDYRITPLPFASPARHYSNQLYTVCPVDYFLNSLKTTMEAKLGRFDGGYRRTTPPLCGQLNHDVVGTAKGNWYHVGSPDSPEDPHLALIDNNVYAPQQTISVGNALPNGGGMWVIFTAVSAGQVNRNFAEVTADGQVYCYDSFFDPIGQPVVTGYTFLVQMPSATTLRLEKRAVATCGAGPWSFSGNATSYQR